MSHDARGCVCPHNCPATEDRHYVDCPAHERYAAFLAMRIPATLSPDPVLLGEVREALERIALPKVGLQGIAEDYGNDTNAYNFHAMRYFARLSQTCQRTAANALAKLTKITGEEV